MDDEAVCARVLDWRSAEELEGRAAELNSDFRDALGEPLARAEVKWNVGPAPIVNAEFERNESFVVRIGRDLRFFPIAGEIFAVDGTRAVLTTNHGLQDGFGRRRCDGVKDFGLFVAHGVGFEGDGWFH